MRRRSRGLQGAMPASSDRRLSRIIIACAVTGGDAAALVDGAEQRSRRAAADPCIDGAFRAVAREHAALPVSLAADRQRAVVSAVVRELQRDRLRPPQTDAVKQRKRGDVPLSRGRGVFRADREQQSHFPGIQRAATRQPVPPDERYVDGAHVVLRSDLAQAPARLQDASKGREVLVGRRGGHFRGDGRDVLEAEVPPWNVGRAGKAGERGEPVQRAAMPSRAGPSARPAR